MKNFRRRNFRRSRKALSPVVAPIILIAVTVAVSIAVAAWMGALTTGFMKNEQLTVTYANINTAANPGSVVIGVSNTGTSSVTISQVWVGNTQIAAGAGTGTIAYADGAVTTGVFAQNTAGTITVTLAAGNTFTSGNSYQFKLVSSGGNSFTYTATAP
jgi:flagellin-like protein